VSIITEFTEKNTGKQVGGDKYACSCGRDAGYKQKSDVKDLLYSRQPQENTSMKTNTYDVLSLWCYKHAVWYMMQLLLKNKFQY